MEGTISRNDPCPCGSGLKYKKCCLESGGVDKQRRARRAQLLAVAVVLVAIVAGFLWGTGAFFAAAFVGGLAVGAYLFFVDPPASRGGGSPGAINFGR